MTTTSASTAPRANDTAGSGPYRLSAAGVLRSEGIKLGSLRSLRLTLIITVLSGLGISAMIVVQRRSEFQGAPADELSGYLLMASSFAFPFLALIFGVLGVFSLASEYSSGMILSTLAAVPSRIPLFVGKALVLCATAAVTALVIVLGGLAIAVAAIPDAAGQLLDPVVVSGVLGTAAFLVLISLLAFGVAGILRSTAGGIAVVVGLTFVLPIAMQMLESTGWTWVVTAADHLPTSLGSILAEGMGGAGVPAGAEADVAQETAASTPPGYWQALCVMSLWAAVSVLPAAILFTRRDAK